MADIGKHLWQLDYWDDLISSDDELLRYESYILANPGNWTRDRWGAVTQYMLGDDALLDVPKRAFVASQGYGASEVVPRRFIVSEHGTFLSRRSREAKTEGPNAALISTFTSAQERAVLRRALANKRRIVRVCPRGIPAAESLSAEQQLALE